MPKEITYLASVYSSEFSSSKKARYKIACAACAFLKKVMNIGVYSPIVHWHSIAILYNIPGDYKTWQEEDERMIELLDSFTILESENWQKSKGLGEELLFAQKLRKPVRRLRVYSENYTFGPRFKLLD